MLVSFPVSQFNLSTSGSLWYAVILLSFCILLVSASFLSLSFLFLFVILTSFISIGGWARSMTGYVFVGTPFSVWCIFFCFLFVTSFFFLLSSLFFGSFFASFHFFYDAEKICEKWHGITTAAYCPSTIPQDRVH